MSSITVVAKLVAKEDAIESVKKETLKMVGPTRQEAGCLEYRLHQDNENPAVFVFYETWQDQAALTAHTQTAHYQSYAAAVAGLLAEKTVHKMTCIA